VPWYFALWQIKITIFDVITDESCGSKMNRY
jgi:hypothetical protein